MAFRLKLVPEKTNIDFFRWQWATFGAAVVMMIASVILPFVIGLNFGIDFKGGTTIRTESTMSIDVGVYRSALEPLDLGDVIISEVRDPSFRADQHVAMIRIQMQEDAQASKQQGAQGQDLACQGVAAACPCGGHVQSAAATISTLLLPL